MDAGLRGCIQTVTTQKSVIASRGKRKIRSGDTGAAIQCRSPQIRIFSPRHWIASRLYVVRIASAAALAKTAHGAGTGDYAGTVSPHRVRTQPSSKPRTRPSSKPTLSDI
ncbi:MAG: hypothetical protein LBM98_11405 [Oscillospiraceae bacterium]|nr:hypothetical protein [Oscillospiraceae bacterium]